MKIKKKTGWLKSCLVPAMYFIGALFSVILIWRNTLHAPSSLAWNVWAFYEWLINYEGGVVRRGLVGAIINSLYYGEEIFVANALVFFFALTFIALATIFWANHVRTVRSALLIIFCPVGFYWMAVGNEYYYRKEILFYVAIVCACFAYRIWKNNNNRYLALILAGYIFFISIFLPLVHEAFIFYGWLISTLIIYQLYQADSVLRKRMILSYTALSIIIFGVLSVYKGDANTSLKIWMSLSDAAKSPSLGSSEPAGAISAIGWSMMKGLSLSAIAVQTGLASYYVFSISLMYLFLGYIVAERRGLDPKDAYLSMELLAPFGMVVASFTPLFILGWDWGRWVTGIWYVSLFIFLLDLDRQIIEIFYRKCGEMQKVFFPAVFPLLLFLGFVTRVPECCFAGSGGSIISNPAFEPVKDFLEFIWDTL